jgi:DNA-binding transcriptional LysR family regulator
VKLTAAGGVLRPYAQRVVDEVTAGAEAARRAASGEIGHLTVGFIESAASTVVPLAVRRFRQERPEVGLTLRELSVGAQVDGLRSGRLDVGIMRPPIDADELTVEPIADERLVVAVGSGHRLAGRDWVAARSVADEPLVALAREVVPGLYDQVLALIREQGGSGRIAQEATSIQAVLGLVAAGLGVALLPESVRSLSRDGVAFVAIRSAARSPVLAARRADDHSPLVEAFLAAARRAADGSGGVSRT